MLFTGVVTVFRLTALNRDDYRWVIAMNRLRHAYVALEPTVEPYLTTSHYDDLPGALDTLGIDRSRPGGGARSIAHLVQTLPGMLTVLVAADGGAVGALIALAFGAPLALAAIAAAVAFTAVLLWVGVWGQRTAYRTSPSLEARFPSPYRTVSPAASSPR